MMKEGEQSETTYRGGTQKKWWQRGWMQKTDRKGLQGKKDEKSPIRSSARVEPSW